MGRHEEWFAAGGGMTTVQGFLGARAARALSAILTYQRDAGLKGSIAEIGAFQGKTFIGMALAAESEERAIGLDIFPGDTAERLLAGLKAALPADTRAQVQIAKTDSTKLTALDWINLLKSPARFVHIDGDHTHDAVLSDIQLATSYLAAGGVVVIDDFLHEWYPDVTEGIIDGLRVAKNLRPVAVVPRSGAFLSGGTKLVCTTPDAVDRHLTLLRATFPELKGRSLKLAGHTCWAFFNND